MAGGKYVFDPKKEKEVDERVEFMIKWVVDHKADVVIDQTNCKMSYINKFINGFKNTHDIEIVEFYQPLWKLYFRNCKRWIQTGKWIPFKVIRTMVKNQRKLDWETLRQYFKVVDK